MFVPSGSIAQCAAGHDLYRVLTDVTSGMVMASAGFEPINGAPKPSHGSPILPCHLCGAPWVKGTPRGGWAFTRLRKPAG